MTALSDAVRVVLVSPRNPLNIGAAARAMSNFGFKQLRVVNAYDVAYHEAKSAVNAAAVLASSEQFKSISEAVADCSLVIGTTAIGHRELKHTIRRLEQASPVIRDHAGSIALLFGSEKFGLSNEDLSHCHWLLRIPTRDEHVSMNLGQAVAICLYELIRNEEAASRTPKEVEPASAADLERFTTQLLDVLRESGYVNPKTADTTEHKIRRMVLRLGLPAKDAQVWLGIWRQILWRLRGL
jgi:TrmH family RNA methyltransferase